MKCSYHRKIKLETKQSRKKSISSVQKRRGRGEAAELSERLAVSHADSCPPLPAKPLGKDDRKLVLRET